ncbi:hypothetical protein HUU59_05565 [bacterium]|nr:hypothetical protein [bacterium]
MRIVINDWLIEDALGNNGEHRQGRSLLVFEKLTLREDVLVVLENSSWTRKAYLMWTKKDLGARRVSKMFMGSVWEDSSNCQRIPKLESFELPESLLHVDEDDHYLIEAYLNGNADLLVTTDDQLIEFCKQSKDPIVVAIHRDDFLRSWNIAP